MKISKIIFVVLFLSICTNGELKATDRLFIDNFPNETLVNIASYVTELKDNRNLSFVSQKWTTIANDDEVIKYVETDLSYKNSHQRDPVILQKLLQKFPSCVKKLDLRFVDLDKLGDNFYLSHLPPLLKELYLGNTDGCPEDIIDSDIINIVAKCPNLQILHLISLDKVTIRGLHALRSLIKLKKLEIHFMAHINLAEVVEYVPNLEEVSIDGISLPLRIGPIS